MNQYLNSTENKRLAFLSGKGYSIKASPTGYIVFRDQHVVQGARIMESIRPDRDEAVQRIGDNYRTALQAAETHLRTVLDDVNEKAGNPLTADLLAGG